MHNQFETIRVSVQILNGQIKLEIGTKLLQIAQLYRAIVSAGQFENVCKNKICYYIENNKLNVQNEEI